MALKYALLAVALALAWFILIRPLRALQRPRRTPPRTPAPLEACPRCGVYRPPGGTCDCNP